MKIAFFSNFLNHHQLPLCLELAKKSEFCFVACEKIPQSRLDMGYEDMNNKYDFVVRAYEDEAAAMEIAKTYDVAIIGAAPLKYIEARMNNNMLTLRFCERSLKKGVWRRFIPTTRKTIHSQYIRYKNSPLYVLGASSYAAYDLVLCGFDKNKCFKFGYFPEIETKNLDLLFELKNSSSVCEILYAGRLLKLKHVFDTVKAVHSLIKKGLSVHFTIIGEGEELTHIEKYISKHSLEKQIELIPFMPASEVRNYMDKADIFVFSSNFYEGWGAVVNEAMNSACVPIVSHAVGSAKFLIKNGENGFVYRFANIKELTNCLERVVCDKNLRKTLGNNAYKTITTDWSAEVACDRLIEFIEELQRGGNCLNLFEDGPLSHADHRG